MSLLSEQPNPIPDAVEAVVATDIERSFHWRSCWYPIVFLPDFPTDRPYAFSIYGQGFVVFQEASGQLVCLEDRCPHRAAKLSDGRLIEGKIECLYHGWQFGPGGTCLHIPQLETEAIIPSRACVQSFPVVEHQGMIWIWANAEEPADRDALPTVEGLDQPQVFVVDTLTDLPFDHTFLVENLLDPAHVYISHDRTELRIRREDAQPLDMEVLSVSAQGIQGRFRGTTRSQFPWTKIEFLAPNLVHYCFSNPAVGVVGGLALYAIPTAYGQSRILVRRYGNIFPRSFRLKPRWVEHLRQNKILEEDMLFIVAQQRYLEQTEQPLKSIYFPLKSADVFVMEHRKWLDRYGNSLPWYEGYATSKYPSPLIPASPDLPNRWQRHTQSCATCRLVHQRLQQLQQGAIGGAIILITVALLAEGWVRSLSVVGFVVAAAIVGVTAQLKPRFEQSFHRH
jgi:phenylpropionate dioxygenase-like ring-hydroxylating dioxygenase large terminal subunit